MLARVELEGFARLWNHRESHATGGLLTPVPRPRAGHEVSHDTLGVGAFREFVGLRSLQGSLSGTCTTMGCRRTTGTFWTRGSHRTSRGRRRPL